MKRAHGGLLLAAVAVAFLTACATMQSRWEEATSAGTIAAYEDFLKEFPEGGLADQARRKRDELYEERAWLEARATNTLAAYQDFMKNHPRGRHADDVAARIEKLSPPSETNCRPAPRKLLNGTSRAPLRRKRS